MKAKERDRRLRQAYIDWSKRYSDRIDSMYPEGSKPHPEADGETDYPEHHAIMGAPPQFEGLLLEAQEQINTEYWGPGNIADRGRIIVPRAYHHLYPAGMLDDEGRPQ